MITEGQKLVKAKALRGPAETPGSQALLLTWIYEVTFLCFSFCWNEVNSSGRPQRSRVEKSKNEAWWTWEALKVLCRCWTQSKKNIFINNGLIFTQKQKFPFQNVLLRRKLPYRQQGSRDKSYKGKKVSESFVSPLTCSKLFSFLLNDVENRQSTGTRPHFPCLLIGSIIHLLSSVGLTKSSPSLMFVSRQGSRQISF